jgi:uncharacterized protein YkwD
MKKLQKQKQNISKNFALLTIAISFGLFIFLPVVKVSADSITTQRVIQLVNKERLAQGFNALVENTVLDKTAQDKANDMIKNDYFAHTSPSGTSPWHWFEKNSYDYKYAGENLAINFTDADSQQKAWMASPSHRKNILNPNYKDIGVAVAKGKVDGETSIITVQLFGTQVAAIMESKKAEPVKQEAVEVKGEQAQNLNQPESVSPESTNLLPLPGGLKASEMQPEKIKVVEPICQNGTCYPAEIKNLLGQYKNSSEDFAWLAVVFILIISVTINAISLSRQHAHNPFIAANTVVLLLILTSMVFWKI